MHIVCRLRDDANLKYLAEPIAEGEKSEIRAARVYSVALKMEILLVHAFFLHKGKKVHKLYFSTDLGLDPLVLMDMYSARFEIEFVYRDGKQYTGLNHCQARSGDKLYFHFNMSLTAVNLAKVKYWLSVDKKERDAFSMDDIKRLYHNEMMIDLFLTEFGINPNTPKNKRKVLKLLNYGAKAA